MSAIAESLRRQRLPLISLAVGLVLGGAAWTLIARQTAHHLGGSDLPVAAPAVEQADWKVDVDVRGSHGKMTRAEKARFEKGRDGAVDAVKRVYDTIFLEPAGVDDLIKSAFGAGAGDALDVRKLGFPRGATNVKILNRSATVGLDGRTVDYAVAEVKIRAEATLSNKTEKVSNRSKLWLERGDDGWQVIAFDVKQDPVR